MNGTENTSFPLPEGVKNLTRALKSDLISFQTDMSLEAIGSFYRDAFSQQGLVEYGLVASTSEEHLSLTFLGLPGERMALVQAVDLGYKTQQDQRYVSLRTAQAPSSAPAEDSASFEEGKRIQLVKDLRETCTYIYAEVAGTGDLLMAGTRAGETPRRLLDRDSFGYWVTVGCEEKEKVLKALIEKIYGRESLQTPEFLALMSKEGDRQDVETRDRLLLGHLGKLYRNNPLAIQDFVTLLKANGIDHQFHTEI